jgi:hypothetical protein
MLFALEFQYVDFIEKMYTIICVEHSRMRTIVCGAPNGLSILDSAFVL